MNENNLPKGVKSLLPGMCPHCSKEIMITVGMTTPQLLSIHKPIDFAKAKEKVLSELETYIFDSEEHKKMAIDYVNAIDFGPSEIEDILFAIKPQK